MLRIFNNNSYVPHVKFLIKCFQKLLEIFFQYVVYDQGRNGKTHFFGRNDIQQKGLRGEPLQDFGLVWGATKGS